MAIIFLSDPPHFGYTKETKKWLLKFKNGGTARDYGLPDKFLKMHAFQWAMMCLMLVYIEGEQFTRGVN